MNGPICKDCGAPVHEYELDGAPSWGHDSLNDALTCSGTENITPQFPEPGAMFDALTDDERLALRSKLADWGHEFAQVGHRLAGTANAADCFTPERTVLWGQAIRFYDAMTELHKLRAEVMAV